jgi:hypothetical protein
VASGKLHRETSGEWWLVTNHHDSAFHRHPTIARGAETVNWTMKGVENSGKFLLPYGMHSDDRMISIFIEDNP